MEKEKRLKGKSRLKGIEGRTKPDSACSFPRKSRWAKTTPGRSGPAAGPPHPQFYSVSTEASAASSQKFPLLLLAPPPGTAPLLQAAQGRPGPEPMTRAAPSSKHR